MRILFFLLISIVTFGQNVGTLPNSVTPIDTASYTLVAQPSATTLRKLSLNRLYNTIPLATGSISGRLSSSDWTLFNSKESALTFSSPLSRSVNTISIPAATTSINGYLTSADWNTFNNKINEFSNYYKVTTWAALQTYVAGLGAGVDVNIFFPYGTYTATSGLTITNKGRVNIVGEGSIILGNFASLGTIFDVDGVTSLNVSGINIDFNFSTVNVQGIYARNITDVCVFDKINVYDYGFATQSGIRLLNVPTAFGGINKNNVPGVTVTNCNFYNPLNYTTTFDYNTNLMKGYGLYFENTAEYAKISDCSFSGLNIGMRNVSGSNMTISNCHFTANLPRVSGVNYGALWIQPGGTNGGKIQVINCTFNHNWGYSVLNEYTTTERPLEIIACHFIANAITPIYINGASSHNRIANCFFDRANEHTTATNDPYAAATTHYIAINNSNFNAIENNTFLVGLSASGRAVTTTGTSDNNFIRYNNYETGLTFTSIVGTANVLFGNGQSVNQLSGELEVNGLSGGNILNLKNNSGSGILTLSNAGVATLTGSLGISGTLSFAGSSGTSGQVLTSNGASTPSWSTPFTDPMTTRGDVIIRNAANATARLGIGAPGTFLSSDGTDVSWATPSGSGSYYAPNTLVANATDANFTATVNGIHNILDGVATSNRVITIPTGANGDVMKFYNTEDVYVWSFTGGTVYLADRVTVVTQLLYNVPCFMEKIDGRWIITN